MSTPLRILEDQPSAKVRRLLSSAHFDAPPKDGEDRLLAALGLTGGLTASALATRATTEVAAGATGFRSATLIKSACIGSVLIGGILAASLHFFPTQTRSEAPLAAPPMSVRAEGSVSAWQAPTTPPSFDLPLAGGSSASPRTLGPERTANRLGRRAPGRVVANLDDAPAREDVTAASAPSSAAVGGPTSSASAIPAASPPAANPPATNPPATNSPRPLRDYEALARARRALDVPKEALALLDAFRRDYPQSRLAPEASVLRIQALAADGQTSEACGNARHFLATYPSITLATTVRALVDRVCTPRQAPSSSSP